MYKNSLFYDRKIYKKEARSDEHGIITLTVDFEIRNNTLWSLHSCCRSS